MCKDWDGTWQKVFLGKIHQVKGFFCITFRHYILLDLHPVCHNGGTVKEIDGNWACTCAAQFTGPYCETGKHLNKIFQNK